MNYLSVPPAFEPGPLVLGRLSPVGEVLAQVILQKHVAQIGVARLLALAPTEHLSLESSFQILELPIRSGC